MITIQLGFDIRCQLNCLPLRSTYSAASSKISRLILFIGLEGPEQIIVRSWNNTARIINSTADRKQFTCCKPRHVTPQAHPHLDRLFTSAHTGLLPLVGSLATLADEYVNYDKCLQRTPANSDGRSNKHCNESKAQQRLSIKCYETEFSKNQQDAQLSQRDRAAGCVSLGQQWKTGTGRQYFTDIIGLRLTTI